MIGVITGDCLDAMPAMPAGCVQTCVTSPPYFGLRDYGHPDQLGLEATPDEFVAALVGVFREVRRVLRDDGTVWLNLGDSYCSTDKWGGGKSGNTGKHTTNGADVPSWAVRARKAPMEGVKPKDLIGIPWMVAFALRADGWYLRMDVIWAKPNPMPESVRDRPTKAHEYLFLLSKSKRYFYDADAIREDAPPSFASRGFKADTQAVRQSVGAAQNDGTGERAAREINGRNKRSVWTVAPKPFPDAHFATFPPKLIEPCILAGCPEKVCSECGAPWIPGEGERELDATRPQARRALELAAEHRLTAEHFAAIRSCGVADAGKAQVTQDGYGKNDPDVQALADDAKRALGGYYREFLLARPSRGELAPSCGHDAPHRPGLVLDPFAGAGTTGVVAAQHGRSFVGIELKPEYATMARERIAGVAV